MRILISCTGNSCKSQMAEGNDDFILSEFVRIRDEIRRDFKEFYEDLSERVITQRFAEKTQRDTEENEVEN